MPGVDGADAEGDQDMALAGAGRPDQAQPGRYRPTDKVLAFLDSL